MALKPIVIDTNFYGDIMFGKEAARKILRECSKALICPIVIGELLYGFKKGRREQPNLEQLRDFFELPSVQIVPLTAMTAEFYSTILYHLGRRGRPIPTHDIWIAACAMEHGAAVATHDKHFKEIPNLLIASPQ